MSTHSETRHQFFIKYLSFHEDLLKVQVKNMQHLVAAFSFRKLSKIDIDEKISNSDHIIHPQNFLIGEKELEQIFDQILPVMKKYYEDRSDIERLENLNDKRKILLKDLVNVVLSRNEEDCEKLSQKFTLPKELIKKVGEYIAAPYLELCSEYFNKKLQDKELNRPICPICGNYPAMALVDEKEKLRQLWCQLCNTEWQFKENCCPFCQNDDLANMRHIFPLEKSANRIDACDKCGNYLKIIDARLISKKPEFVVEYISTYRLDLLAIQQGYHKYSYCERLN